MLIRFSVALTTPATFFVATAEKAAIERKPGNMNLDSM